MFYGWYLFQPSLIFVFQARSLPQSRAPERCFTRVGSELTPKHQARLEMLVSNKNSCLLDTNQCGPVCWTLTQQHQLKSLILGYLLFQYRILLEVIQQALALLSKIRQGLKCLLTVSYYSQEILTGETLKQWTLKPQDHGISSCSTRHRSL